MIVLRFLAALGNGWRAAMDRWDGWPPPKMPTRGCAWTGPWPRGSVPVCVTYGDADPIFVGYLPYPAGGVPDVPGFWREHADLIDHDEQTREGR